jgi:hypothetical protein
MTLSKVENGDEASIALTIVHLFVDEGRNPDYNFSYTPYIHTELINHADRGGNSRNRERKKK